MKIDFNDKEREFIVRCISIQALTDVVKLIKFEDLRVETQNRLNLDIEKVNQLFESLDLDVLANKLNAKEFYIEE